MSGWREVSLSEVAPYWTGKVEAQNLNEENFISADNMLPDKGGIVNSVYAPTAGKSTSFKPKDILVSNIRPYFKKIWFANKIGGCSNDVIVFRSTNVIVPRFMYYCLSNDSFFDYMMSGANGTKMPRGNKQSIPKYKINLPPLPTQQKIAKILSNYDDLIENNLKRIKLLEESARLTYEEWFLRFRIDGKNLDIDPTTDLPFGWSNKSFNSICKKISSGGTPSRANKKYWDFDDYDWVTTKELRDGYIYDTKEKISLLGLEKSSAKLFPKGTIVMAIYASPTLGRLGVITKESCFNQAAVGFIIDENFISNEFLYCKLISERVGLNALAMGAAQQNINLAKVKNYEVVIPDLELLQEFTNVTRPMFNEIENLGLQNQLLKEARDILLPRLMTGMIDTDDMDIAV